MTKHITLHVLYIFFLLCTCIYTYNRPAYNWDMLGYMGVVVAMGGQDAGTIHRITYSEAKKQLPASVYGQLTDTNHHFRKQVTGNPVLFQQQLAYYAVKPLYTGIVYLLYKTGVSLVTATLLPSVISYFFIGMLLFYWLRRHMKIGIAFVMSILLMIASPMIHTAELSTPDCLSAMLLLFAFYYLIEAKRLLIACVFLMLAVLARADNIIVSFLLLLLVAIGGKWTERPHAKPLLFAAAGLVIGYFVASYGAVRYGWNVTFVPSFLAESTNTPFSKQGVHSFKDWLLQIHSSLMVNMLNYHLFIYLPFAAMLFIGQKSYRWKDLNFEQCFVLTTLLAIFLRLLLHPEMPDRFYLAYYILFVILAIQKLVARHYIPSNR